MNVRYRGCLAPRGARHLHKHCSARSHTDFAIRRSRQRRVPQQSSAIAPAAPNYSACQNKPRSRAWKSLTQNSRTWNFKRNSRLSFALRSEWRSSLKLSHSIGPAFWNLSIGRALALRTWPPPVAPTGPATLDRCCDRNVVGPGGYSKRFFCISIRHYGGNFRPATARWMPARSALGGCPRVNPAAVIKASISRLWPRPASTTRAAPGARRQAACGISAR